MDKTISVTSTEWSLARIMNALNHSNADSEINNQVQRLFAEHDDLRRVLADTVTEVGRLRAQITKLEIDGDHATEILRQALAQRDELADLLTAYTNEIAREDFKWSTLNEIAADARAVLAKL